MLRESQKILEIHEAAEDFLLAVLHSCATAKAILCGAEANDMLTLLKTIVDYFFQFSLLFWSSTPVNYTENVNLYAIEVVTLGITSMTILGKGMVTGFLSLTLAV